MLLYGYVRGQEEWCRLLRLDETTHTHKYTFLEVFDILFLREHEVDLLTKMLNRYKVAHDQSYNQAEIILLLLINTVEKILVVLHELDYFSFILLICFGGID